MSIVTPATGLSVETIQLQSTHGTMHVYLAAPAGQDRGPGLLLLHEVSGLSEYIKDVARRLAHAGFTVLAPGLFHGLDGIDASDPPAIWRVLDNVADQRFVDDIALARDELRSRTDPGAKLGVIGFCLGGTYSVIAGEQLSDVSAVVSFYGPIRKRAGKLKSFDLIADAAQMHANVLLIYGDADHAIPVQDVQALSSKLLAAGKEVEIHIYADAPHGFHSDARPERYREPIARDAWQRTLAFLNRTLRECV